ncbi:MAG: transglycosylase SLT domain-containing protein [Gemmobacter sp.]|nr:transglycosylase SLT domain-containing protein [Gemmobacter sp.]
MRYCIPLALLPLAATLALPVLAGESPCESLAEAAARQEGIPQGLLSAIARTESGRGDGAGGVEAWPWTLNQGGKGSFHDSRDAALVHLENLLAQGVRNVDIGCMQLNYHWHHTGFPSVSAMMEPEQNTRYAAQFLRALHDRYGSWEAATAAYHSLDAGRGQRYLAKVNEHREDVPLQADPGIPAPDLAAARIAGLFALPSGPLVALRAEAAVSPPEDRPAAALPPLDLSADPVPLLAQDMAPPRLQRQWADLAAMRIALAEQP